MKQTYSISQDSIHLALKFLREHAILLRSQHFYLPASSEVVDNIAAQIAEEVALQLPQTPEQQVAVLTEVFGCGPVDEAVGNKG